MSELPPNLTLLKHANGVSEPLYFDRQIVRASDLNLGRESRNAELDRMRRYALGTGIVAGLILEPGEKGVVLTGGYGVSPSGNEVFLERDLQLENLDEAIKELCPEGSDACALDEVEETGVLSAWLLIRPMLAEAQKRPGVSDDCGHPANVLRPARACHTVEIVLLKTLPDAMRHTAPTCKTRNPFICFGKAVPNIEIPAAYDPHTDLLVLGRVSFSEDGFDIEMIERRRLLPMQLMQEWLMACLCNQEPPEEPDLDIETWEKLDDLTIALGYDSRFTGRPAAGAPRLSAVDQQPRIMEPDLVEKLMTFDITGPVQFMRLTQRDSMRFLGLPLAQVRTLKRELEAFIRAIDTLR
ncbi:hypothetical protein [Cognatishimia sp. MH4019]|uniref:hypothetical protein n=1 Tax=Cognatishimia sp. MH4019 TaxID=2854030 RepID=UPI001CD295EC|nr:hypothetical protein [Cognatishimia sp. MH4019]